VTSSLPIVLFTLRTRVCCWNDRARLRRPAERPRTGIGPAVPARDVNGSPPDEYWPTKLLIRGWERTYDVRRPIRWIESRRSRPRQGRRVRYRPPGRHRGRDRRPGTKGIRTPEGWIEEGEAYDVEAVVESLRERVRSLAPDASFEYERIREFRRKRNSPNTSNDWPERTIRASSSSAVRTSAAS